MRKKIACVLVWLAALCVCLLAADRLTRRDDSARKYGAFFEDQQDYDVLFLGTSHVLDDISPMELWRDFGITGYNMGNSSEPLGMTEWVLRLALQTHKPDVAVIDVFYIDRPLDQAWAYSFRHMFLDAVPLSLAKMQAVRATLPQSEQLEFLMPFSLYHGRWEELLSGQSERMVDCERFMMGSELRIGRTAVQENVRTQAMTQEELSGFEPLRQIAALCRENGIEPVFVVLPTPADEATQMNLNAVAQVAQALDVPFLNMLDLDVVDFATDFYDELGHMNPDGASKTTAYLGQWLRERYGLDDHRLDDSAAYWYDALTQYEAFRSAVWSEN